MSRIKKRKNNRKNKIKKILLLLFIFIGVFFGFLIVYGQDVFYTIKTFLYENKALNIKINIEKHNNLDDVNLNFANYGSCDVYLRSFVFVYPKTEGNVGVTLSNESMKINYGNEDYWIVGEDNYVYYTKPLKVGDITEKPMIESIEINLSEEEKNMLSSYELGVDIVMEAVQVNNFAYKYEWDMEEMNFEKLFYNSEDEKIESIKLKFN